MSPASRRPPSASLMRWVRGLLPPAGGGTPPALAAARAQLSGWVVGAIALVVGASAGFLLVVVGMALPNVPSSLVGLVAGVLLGSAVALTLASKYPVVRKVGALAILLAPLLLLAAPFLLIAAAIALLRRTAPPSASPRSEPRVIEAVALSSGPPRKHRSRA
jgi:hypothetical protein